VIAATNKSIKDLRGNGLFRSDFYYRLCSDCIIMPSLSERIRENPDELRLILNSIIERLTGEKSEELVSLVLKSLEKSPGRDYSWPVMCVNLNRQPAGYCLQGNTEVNPCRQPKG
jgi:transcriptional regulator of acetoin/glycerol metabolism